MSDGLPRRPPPGGQKVGSEDADIGFPAAAAPPARPQPGKPHYRVREYSIDGSVRTFSRVYDRLEDAVATADLLVAIEARHRRPTRAVVFNVWTGEILASRRPDQEIDDKVCPTCGQTRDPFAAAWQAGDDPFPPAS